jgi:hypothetical protein
MFVAFAVEHFIEVQSLLPLAKLDFQRPTRTVAVEQVLKRWWKDWRAMAE